LKCLPPTDEPTEQLRRLYYYGSACIRERKYAAAQKTTDQALQIKIQPGDVLQCNFRYHTLLNAGFLAHKRADPRSAEHYWQSAKSLATKELISNRGLWARGQLSIDECRKTFPEPELFK